MNQPKWPLCGKNMPSGLLSFSSTSVPSSFDYYNCSLIPVHAPSLEDLLVLLLLLPANRRTNERASHEAKYISITPSLTFTHYYYVVVVYIYIYRTGYTLCVSCYVSRNACFLFLVIVFALLLLILILRVLLSLLSPILSYHPPFPPDSGRLIIQGLPPRRAQISVFPAMPFGKPGTFA